MEAADAAKAEEEQQLADDDAVEGAVSDAASLPASAAKRKRADILGQRKVRACFFLLFSPPSTSFFPLFSLFSLCFSLGGAASLSPFPFIREARQGASTEARRRVAHSRRERESKAKLSPLFAWR